MGKQADETSETAPGQRGRVAKRRPLRDDRGIEAPMEPNPYRRFASRWWLASGVSGLVALGLWQAHEAGARVFLVFLGGVWAACGVPIFALLGYLLGRTATKYDALVNGGALVQWTCGDAQWRTFRELEKTEVLAKQKGVAWLPWLFLVLFVGAAVAVVAEKSSQWDLGLLFVLLGVGMFVGFRVLLGRARERALREEPPSTVFIGREALVFRGQYVGWRQFGTSLAAVRHDVPNRVLRLTIRVQTNHGHNDVETRVPVPEGRESEVDGLVRSLVT